MYIPDYLIEQIKTGNVVLCLGAGASMGAKNSKNEEMVLGDGLKKD